MSATAATTGEHLLNEIHRRPADNTIRLAYADWLDEVGRDPWHAELIRLQIGRYEGWPDTLKDGEKVAWRINEILGGPGAVLLQNVHGSRAPYHHIARGFRWAVECQSVSEAMGPGTEHVVSAAPITHVKIRSLSPLYVALPHGRGWQWAYRRGGDVGGHVIPLQIAANMPLTYPPRVRLADRKVSAGDDIVWRYGTPYDADDAVARAAADWHRSGLSHAARSRSVL